MTPDEVVQAITYANQIDARVQLNEAAFDVWEQALISEAAADVKQAIVTHYAVGKDGGDAPPITPAAIKGRLARSREAAARKRAAEAALPAGRPLNVRALRQKDRLSWDMAYTKGRIDRLRRLHTKGLCSEADLRLLAELEAEYGLLAQEREDRKHQAKTNTHASKRKS